MIQIIKLILILHKDNPSKYKMQFWNNFKFYILELILVGQPLLGRFTTVPSFLHLWIMALIVVRWSPKALEMAL